MPRPQTPHRSAAPAAVVCVLIVLSLLSVPLLDGTLATAAEKHHDVSALWKAFPLGAKATVSRPPGAVVHPSTAATRAPAAVRPAPPPSSDAGRLRDEYLIIAAITAIAVVVVAPSAIRRRRRRGALIPVPAGASRMRDAATGLTLPAWVVESRQPTARSEATELEQLLVELTVRLESLAVAEAELAERGRAIAEREEELAREHAGSATPAVSPATTGDHLLFIASPDGYRVVERAGALPHDRTEIDLALEDSADRRYVVSRIGRSPIPHDDRPCAFLEQVA